MGDSKIEWTEKTWNPVTGCSKVSQGCKNCYAERLWPKVYGRTGRKFTDVACHEDRLKQPLGWRKPQRVFVNSMSDLFHEDVPESFLDRVFDVMEEATWHTFQILTKRSARMRDYLQKRWAGKKPPKNIWLGVSVEDQATADARVPDLLATPAAVRFVSYEPALGAVEFGAWMHTYGCNCGWGGEYGNDHCIECGWRGVLAEEIDNCPDCGNDTKDYTACPNCGAASIDGVGYGPNQATLDLVIVGGESGSGARPMHPDWPRSVRDQCQEAGVAFFFKQWGAWEPSSIDEWAERDQRHKHVIIAPNGVTDSTGAGLMMSIIDETSDEHRLRWMHYVGKKAAGRVLDGRTWDELPGLTRPGQEAVSPSP